MISMTPAMPDLHAISWDLYDSVVYSLNIRYTRSNRNDNITFVDTLPPFNWWDIYNYASLCSLFYGGQATISCRSLNDTCISRFKFAIRGYNPAEEAVESYIEDSLEGRWYAKYVAIQESGWQNNRTYLQFNEIGAYNCDSNDIRHTPNWGDDGQGRPGGFGMFQLTYFTDIGGNTRVPNSNELWNWKANACAGENYLDLLQAGANQYMADERNEANNCTGEYVYNPPDDYVSGNVIFSGEQWADTTIEHAVALKRYNGVGGTGNGQFCEFRDDDDEWHFNEYSVWNGQHIYYVDSVCQWVE
jgi:hypothetical protein